MKRGAIALIFVAALTACDDRVVSHFSDYAAIPEQSGIWIWLPVFFPISAREIKIATNLDLDFFMLILRWRNTMSALILKQR